MILELFAGPGGFSQGLKLANFQQHTIGIEADPDACVTACQAGHNRIEFDVSEINPREFQNVEAIVASPPCQGVSMAGQGKGRKDAELLLWAIEYIGGTSTTSFDIIQVVDRNAHDPRTSLMLEPLRYIECLEPEWIVLEQAPTVLPIWKAMAKVLETWGYRTATGTLTAEMFGVPQTRNRAFLMAHQTKRIQSPMPTHSRYHFRRPDDLDPDVEPWVAMYDVLTPSLDFIDLRQRSNYSARKANASTAKERGRTMRSLWQPSVTITSKSFAWESYETGAIQRATTEECALLQGFPENYPWHGTGTSIRRQIGNAVPPQVAAAVFQEMTDETATVPVGG